MPSPSPDNFPKSRVQFTIDGAYNNNDYIARRSLEGGEICGMLGADDCAVGADRRLVLPRKSAFHHFLICFIPPSNSFLVLSDRTISYTTHFCHTILECHVHEATIHYTACMNVLLVGNVSNTQSFWTYQSIDEIRSRASRCSLFLNHIRQITCYHCLEEWN